MKSRPNHKPNSNTTTKMRKTKQSSLRDLLKTSHAIKRVLEPLNPRKSFVSELADNLDSNVEHARDSMQTIEHRKQRIKWTAIGAGVGVYSFSLSLIFIKLVKWFLKRRGDNMSDT
jgi:hypothetical protein